MTDLSKTTANSSLAFKQSPNGAYRLKALKLAKTNLNKTTSGVSLIQTTRLMTASPGALIETPSSSLANVSRRQSLSIFLNYNTALPSSSR